MLDYDQEACSMLVMLSQQCPLRQIPPPIFAKCQNDKVHQKSMVAENEGILSVHEFNYHSDGST